MPIDPKAVGSTGNPTRRSWTSKDALLYAVGVGAGTSELSLHDRKHQGRRPTRAADIRGDHRRPAACRWTRSARSTRS